MLSTVAVQQQDDWILLDEGALKGMTIVVDKSTTEIISLSTNPCRDADRWRNGMPSVIEYHALRSLDLDSCRYIVELHDTVGSLSMLRRMLVTKCDRLERLPKSINCLHNLQEVGFLLYDEFLHNVDEYT